MEIVSLMHCNFKIKQNKQLFKCEHLIIDLMLFVSSPDPCSLFDSSTVQVEKKAVKKVTENHFTCDFSLLVEIQQILMCQYTCCIIQLTITGSTPHGCPVVFHRDIDLLLLQLRSFIEPCLNYECCRLKWLLCDACDVGYYPRGTKHTCSCIRGQKNPK